PAGPPAGRLLGLSPRSRDRDQPRHGNVAPVDRQAVRLELLAVELALPGDLGVRRVRVHHDREAARGRALDGARRRRREPDRRVRLLARLRQHLDPVEPEVSTVPREALLGPGTEHDVDGLLEPWAALVLGHAEGEELGAVEAAARA